MGTRVNAKRNKTHALAKLARNPCCVY
jgi:hypothetical protein